MQYFSPKILLWIYVIEISTETQEFFVSWFVFCEKTCFKVLLFMIMELILKFVSG